MGLFGKSKREKQLEQELINEIKSFAGVSEFPYEDAKTISDLLVAYGKGNNYVDLAMYSAVDVIEKYPNLCDNWDALMIKYKKMGLFPRWIINITD